MKSTAIGKSNLCQCGCGQPTNLSKITNVKRGYTKGQPLRYLHGHNAPRVPDDHSGDVYGQWTLISLADRGDCHHTRWLCRCECGIEQVNILSNMVSGKSKNLGCKVCCRLPRRARPFETIYKMVLNAAKVRTYIKLSYDEFLEFTKIPICHYCNEEVQWKPYGGQSSGYKLDRKDNSLGYSKENCVVCCARCNRAKSNHFTYEEWVKIGKLIRSWK